MKKLLLPLFAIILCSGILFAEGTQPPGSGTSGDKYLVSTLDHLLWISTNPASWGSYFSQTANIDAAETSSWNDNAGFIPIGNGDPDFTGSYNGGNHSISNLYINRPSEDYVGLFGLVSGATISNLALVNADITGNVALGSLVGSLGANSTVNNCSSSGSVEGYMYLGGLIGTISDSDIINSHCTCEVTGTGYYTAGLVGIGGGNALIQNCYYSGNVYGADGAGGIIASSCDAPVIENCYSTGNVNGESDTGGLTGYSLNSFYYNCYSLSDVTRTSGTATSVGGFCGSGDGDTFEYCYAAGGVDCGSETSKGFIGHVYDACTTTANFFDSQATGQTTGTGATPKTEAEMKTLATFTDAGWDFEMETTNGTNDYWDMDLSGSFNYGYPFLDWQNGGETALPVELSGFSAHCAGQAVVLEWATESETDNLGFVLERANGVSATWQVIASYQTNAALQSRGNSTSCREYSFTDNTTVAGMNYQYRLSDVNINGSITVLSSLSIEVTALPLTTTLAKAYPNPFNPRTVITYDLAVDGDVSITVFDMLGRKVRELQTGHKSAGSYQVIWNGADDSGVPLASGSYLVRLQTKDITQVQKVMFLK
ncbi:MAG TPA: FlgD immunoglobulin-like domain containing protein [bacterium]|nr:FlgD immunoglobulin-like domain containing protein [bacterium]HPN44604.1 FlgD immunoglobulin-like domain containing protein [bacterium]